MSEFDNFDIHQIHLFFSIRTPFFLLSLDVLIFFYIAEMVNQMSDFDNFDIHQISSKLAQRWLFVCSFYCRKSFVLGSFDNAENAKRQFFFGTPNITISSFRKIFTHQGKKWMKKRNISQNIASHKSIANVSFFLLSRIRIFLRFFLILFKRLGYFIPSIRNFFLFDSFFSSCFSSGVSKGEYGEPHYGRK